MTLPRDWSEFFACFQAHEVDFIVVGGHAVAFHGFPRFTRDIDLFVRADSDNAAQVVAALIEFGIARAASVHETLATPGRMVQIGREPYRIDILTTLTGLTYAEASRRAVPGMLGDIALRFISLDDLRTNKRAAGRPRDLADLADLGD